MPLVDQEELNYSKVVADETTPRTREVVVSNDHPEAVLHIGLRSDAAWLEFYPAEFAIGPGERQRIVAELHPERNNDRAMSVTKVSLLGQYIAPSGPSPANLPPSVAIEVRIVPPASDCPTCGADLPEGAQECRRCGERLRLCKICGAVNTWRVHVCRVDPKHLIRRELDWLVAPGGSAAHAQPPQRAAGTRLAKKWSVPSFPAATEAGTLEWCAPVMVFGIVIASAIDGARERSIVYAFDIAAGTWLWEHDLGDPSGIYPDRGGLAVSEADGLLYAATLNGTVVALDSVRGTLRWTGKVAGPVYGGPALSENLVAIPAGKTLHLFDRLSGAALGQIACEGRLDTSPAIADQVLVAADDSGAVSAFDLPGGALRWRHNAGGSFDAAPLIARDTVYAANTAGGMVALSLADGAVRWSTQISTKAIGAAPAVSSDGLLYVGADDGCMHVIAADTGHQIRTRRISETPIRCAPVCGAAAVFAGANDGSIYAMTPDYASDRAYETTQGARLGGAGLALYGEHLAAVATNGLLYLLRIAG